MAVLLTAGAVALAAAPFAAAGLGDASTVFFTLKDGGNCLCEVNVKLKDSDLIS